MKLLVHIVKLHNGEHTLLYGFMGKRNDAHCKCIGWRNPRCPVHKEKDRPNEGKSYYDYLKEEEKINGAKREARMKAAIMAMKERKRLGIDISIPGERFGARVIEKFK